MSLKEVSEYLGWREHIIEELIREKEFPGMKIDKDWFFSRYLIDKWVEKFVDTFKGQILTREELESGNFEMKGEKLKGGAMTKEEMEPVFED